MEVPDKLFRPVQGENSHEQEICAAIYANPENEENWAVYGDWLQSNNNPRGEFMALDVALRAAPMNRSIKLQKDALLSKHLDLWLGDILKRACVNPLRAPALVLKWRHGYIHRAVVRGNRDKLTPHINAIIYDLFASPSSKFISELKYSPAIKDEDPFNKFIRSLVFGELFSQSLRILMLSDGYQFQRQSGIHHIHELLSRLPALEFLEISGTCVFSVKLAHERLKQLHIRLQHPLGDSMEILAQSYFPNLEYLKLTLQYNDFRRGRVFDPFKSLGHGKGFPKLKTLGIRDLGESERTLKSLVKTPLFAGLETLRLEAEGRHDIWPELLKTQNNPLQHLKKLELRLNYFPPEVETLRQIFGDRLEINYD